MFLFFVNNSQFCDVKKNIEGFFVKSTHKQFQARITRRRFPVKFKAKRWFVRKISRRLIPKIPSNAHSARGIFKSRSDTQGRINFGKNNCSIFSITHIPRRSFTDRIPHTQKYMSKLKDTHSPSYMPPWDKYLCILPITYTLFTSKTDSSRQIQEDKSKQTSPSTEIQVEKRDSMTIKIL